MSAFEELGGRKETYAEALARCIVLQPHGLTEQEQADKIAADREKMRQHDAHFADDFISTGEQYQISRVLARQYGVFFNEPDENTAETGDD